MVNRITRRDFLVGADEHERGRQRLQCHLSFHVSTAAKLLVCIIIPLQTFQPLDEYHHTTHIGLRITYYLSKIIILFGKGEPGRKLLVLEKFLSVSINLKNLAPVSHHDHVRSIPRVKL